MGNIVLSGADQLLHVEKQYLKGKRFGLLTNQTGITAKFESTIHICANLQTAKLSALFAPEHGVRGERQAGVKFGDEFDDELGIPIFSLYGDLKPTAGMLEQLDAVVFDMQDLGVRFYTRLTALVYMIKHCAAYGKSVIVLDRPNPLGGVAIEGGLLQEGYESAVGGWQMPARTGLTVGEFARLVADNIGADCDLHVVPLKNWRRDMDYPATGLPWIMTSLNIPTVESARIYAGNCLFEGTNLSEGRGTTKPFEMIGAPWLDSRQVARDMNALGLPGVHFLPVTFTPTFSKHQGVLCNGILTYVTDKQAYRPVETSLHLLHHIQFVHPEHFEWLKPRADRPDAKHAIDLLSGSDLVRRTLHEPDGLQNIIEQWEKDSAQWRQVREPYLLYEEGTARE